MLIGRRTFLRNTALLGTATAVANLLSLSSIVVSHAALLPCSLSPQLDAAGADMNSVVFKIDGWKRNDAIALDGTTKTSSELATNVASGDQVWISINQFWRTAWR
jgi:hypothetical protein